MFNTKSLFSFFTLVAITPFSIFAQQAEVEGGIIADSIWIQNLPAFRAELSADYDFSAFPDDTLIVNNNWDDSGIGDHLTTFDQDNNFNASSGEFIVPRDGIYHIDIQLHFKSHFFLEDLVFVCLAINGSLDNNSLNASYSLWSTGNTNNGPIPARKTKSISGNLKLNKGDVLNLHLGYNDDYGGAAQAFLEKYSSINVYLISDTN